MSLGMGKAPFSGLTIGGTPLVQSGTDLVTVVIQ